LIAMKIMCMLFLMLINGETQKLFNNVIAMLNRNCIITCYKVK